MSKKVEVRVNLESPKATPVFDMWRLAYPLEDPPPRASWFAGSPAIFVGAWEDLAFRRRAGFAWSDETEAYSNEFSDEALDRIIAMGCNHLVLSHTKGYGRKAVRDEMAYCANVIKRAHVRKLRVGLYLRIDNAIPELLRAEYPDLDEWLTVGEHGRRSHYSSQQTFRSRICHLHPSATRYLENELRHAVVEMGADLIHLDGLHFSFYPSETCRCARCTRAYRKWLQHEYPPGRERDELFGPVDFETIELPSFDPLQQAEDPGFAPFGGMGDLIRSPDIQSWYRFRWDGEFALVRHLRRFIHELNPNVAVTINPAWGSCYNSYRIFTQWAERLLPWADAVWSEDPLHLEFSQGRLISKLGTYKTTREYDIPTCFYHWMRDPGRLEASHALSAAANGGHLACMGFTIRHLPHFTVGKSVKEKVAHWVNDHANLYMETRPAGEIALLRHQPSLAWNSRSPWWTAIACEQLLVQMHVPWRMFDRIDAQLLGQVKTLLLPEAVCLSDPEIELLKSWIRSGGNILVTSGTASHNQHLRRRPINPLAAGVPAWQDRFNELNPADIWFDWNEDEDPFASIPPGIVELGKGRVGFWPKIQTRCGKSTAYNYLTPDDWWPPEQSDQLADFIQRLHGLWGVRLHGPPHLVIEHHRKSDGTDLLHVVQVQDTIARETAMLSGSVLLNRRIQVHTLDGVSPASKLDQQELSLQGIGRYTIVELSPRR